MDPPPQRNTDLQRMMDKMAAIKATMYGRPNGLPVTANSSPTSAIQTPEPKPEGAGVVVNGTSGNETPTPPPIPVVSQKMPTPIPVPVVSPQPPPPIPAPVVVPPPPSPKLLPPFPGKVKVDNTKTPNSGISALQLSLLQYQEKQAAEVLKKNQELDKSAKPSSTSRKSRPKWFQRDLVSREITEQTRALPISSKKDELIQLIKKHQIVIVVGETGSGKSTQIPQYIADAGIAGKGVIGITQPRRVAAKSLAQRVSEECGVEMGSLVGYAVRFESCISSKTVIKYMTDGLLVKECTEEPNMDSYSVVMVDEAHERSIHTDVCFGLLKRAAKIRPDLKIIISSATLELEKFSKFFNDAPIFHIEGKEYDVEVIYKPCKTLTMYYDDVLVTILDIHVRCGKGDILVFLTGQDEIDKMGDDLGKLMQNEPCLLLTVVPCHGTLPFESQQKMFEKAPVGFRKVVLATNIAETSVTIDGIVYVVDCGFVKESRYNPSTKIDSLVKVPITKFQAIQRKGRAGRTQPGVCYRLYSEDTYKRFKEAQEPDIKRSNVEAVVLDLISMGIKNPMEFEFMDAPPEQAIFEALISLMELSALDEALVLTPLGQQMARFPLDPPLAKVLITSAELGCAIEMLKIVAILSTQYQNLFHSKPKAEADKKKEVFHQPDGDHLTLLKVCDEFAANGFNEGWCKENFIQFRYLAEARDIRKQLKDIMIKNKLLTPKGLSIFTCEPTQLKENITKAFTAGYFFQLAKRKGTSYAYQKISSSGVRADVYLHPSCSLFKLKPEWIIFHEVMETTKAFVKGAITIKPEWIKEYAPGFANKAETNYGIKF